MNRAENTETSSKANMRHEWEAHYSQADSKLWETAGFLKSCASKHAVNGLGSLTTS